MNKREENKYSMFNAVLSTLDENLSAVQGLGALNTAYMEFKSDLIKSA